MFNNKLKKSLEQADELVRYINKNLKEDNKNIRRDQTEMYHQIDMLAKEVKKQTERINKLEKALGNEFTKEGYFGEILRALGHEYVPNTVQDELDKLRKQNSLLVGYLDIHLHTTSEKTQFVKNPKKK